MENHDCPLIDPEIQPWPYRRRPLGFRCIVVAADQVIEDLNLFCGKPRRAAGASIQAFPRPLPFLQ